MKVKSKILLVLMLSLSLVGLSGCFGKEKAATDDNKKTVEAKETAKANDTTTTTDTTKGTGTTATTKETTKENSTNTATKETSKENSTTSTKASGSKTANSTTSTKTSGSKTTNSTTTTGKKQNDGQAKPKNEEKEISDFVLNNTKIVKIFNISRRVHEQHPDLGPFFFVRGIDERGQKSEIWIKDMKVFEMVNTN